MTLLGKLSKLSKRRRNKAACAAPEMKNKKSSSLLRSTIASVFSPMYGQNVKKSNSELTQPPTMLGANLPPVQEPPAKQHDHDDHDDNDNNNLDDDDNSSDKCKPLSKCTDLSLQQHDDRAQNLKPPQLVAAVAPQNANMIHENGKDKDKNKGANSSSHDINNNNSKATNKPPCRPPQTSVPVPKPVPQPPPSTPHPLSRRMRIKLAQRQHRRHLLSPLRPCHLDLTSPGIWHVKRERQPHVRSSRHFTSSSSSSSSQTPK